MNIVLSPSKDYIGTTYNHSFLPSSVRSLYNPKSGPSTPLGRGFRIILFGFFSKLTDGKGGFVKDLERPLLVKKKTQTLTHLYLTSLPVNNVGIFVCYNSRMTPSLRECIRDDYRYKTSTTLTPSLSNPLDRFQYVDRSPIWTVLESGLKSQFCDTTCRIVNSDLE